MTRCTKCVLPDSYPGITFSQNGVCNYCHSYQKKEYLGEARLTEILESYRNKGKDYDVVVGVSGGRDSSYALYYLVKKAKLRVLAYTIDNGVVTEQAKVNMKSMMDILGVKLIVDDNDLTRRCLKHNLKSWIFKPSPGMILLTCTICNSGIKTGLLKTAKKYGIPLIVTGGGGIELAGFKGIFVGENPGKKEGDLGFGGLQNIPRIDKESPVSAEPDLPVRGNKRVRQSVHAVCSQIDLSEAIYRQTLRLYRRRRGPDLYYDHE